MYNLFISVCKFIIGWVFLVNRGSENWGMGLFKLKGYNLVIGWML